MVDLCDYDKLITESEFKAKIDSIFIMLYISIMTDNLKRVSHFVDFNLLKRYEEMLDELNRRNERQMYDLLTVEGTEIESKSFVNDKMVITAKLTAKYMDYVENKKTKEIVKGNNKERIEKTIYLTLKHTNIDYEDIEYTSIANIKDFDWKLIDLKIT